MTKRTVLHRENRICLPVLLLLGCSMVLQSAHGASPSGSPPAKTNHSTKKKATHPAETEKTTAREIYSAMEPEPGPGAKTPQKQTLKQIDSFDPVPNAQREPITRRLRLIERLIRDFGRAYDYRAVTIAELTAILASLEKSGGSNEPQKNPEALSTDLESDEPSPPPPPKKIHLPELNTSRPAAPAEDSEEGGALPDSPEFGEPSQLK